MANLHILPKKLLEELEHVVHSLKNQGVNLILFGSFAEGKGRAHSDLDLAYDGGRLDPEVIHTMHQKNRRSPHRPLSGSGGSPKSGCSSSRRNKVTWAFFGRMPLPSSISLI